MQVALLPQGFIENSEYFQFPHPRNGKSATFIRNYGKLYELFNVDRPHSSFFVGNSAVSDGAPLYSALIHPLFIVLPFIASRGKQMISENEFFFDSPYAQVADQVKPYLTSICQSMELGDEIRLNYDQAKTLDWLVSQTMKLLPYLKKSHDLEDHLLIEVAHDVIRHYINDEFANLLKEFLREKYPGSFPKKSVIEAEIIEEGKAAAKKEVLKKKTSSKLQKPEGNMSISSFFAPVKSKK